MDFSFFKLKKNIFFFGIVTSFFSGFSCQHLSQGTNFTKTTPDSYQNKTSKPVVIDKNYFEQRILINYLKAEKAFFESNFTKALEYLKTAKAFAPQSIHLQKRMAEIYESEGLLAEAIYKYESLTKSSNKKEFIEKLTDLYALQQMNDTALKQNNRLLKNTPHSFPLIIKKAILHINQENWESALKTLTHAENKAELLEEKIQSLLFQAYIFAKQKKTEKSLKTIQKIKNLDFPEEALVLKIVDFYKNFNENRAMLYLEDFQQEKGVTASVSNILLNHALSSKDWKKAMHHIQQLKDLGQMEEQHYFYSAMFCIKEKKYNKAILYLKDLITQSPQNGHYNYLLALSYEKNRQWLMATKLYQEVPSHSPYFLVSHLQLANLWQKQGQYKKSFALLNHLSFNNPVSPQAVLLYAESLWKTGNKRQALNILTKALKYHPKHPDILFLRGFYFKKSGAVDMALEDMKQILKIHSDHSEALKLSASLQSENT